MTQYLTIADTAQLLGVTERTVGRLAKKGLLTKNKVKGRVYFNAQEVTQLNDTRSSSGTLGVIYKRLDSLTRRQSVLEGRVAVLELALSSRQSAVTLDPKDISRVRDVIKSTLKRRDLSFEDIQSWSDDLLRLDRNTCKALGVKRLTDLTSKLIAVGDESPAVLRDPSKSIYLDKLVIFTDRLANFKKT